MHRFFVPKESFKAEAVTLPVDLAHQIRDVLRMKPAQQIIVLDNSGWEYTAVLEEIRKDTVIGKIVNKRKATSEPAAQITLYQSIIKQSRFEWILQKCTELGVCSFVPVVTERAVVNNPHKLGKSKTARWLRIITEAAEQSQRGRIPELATAISFEQILTAKSTCDYLFLACPQSGPGLRQMLKNKPVGQASIGLLIGPEGGFTEKEIEQATAAGAVPINLGSRILRSETAAVVLTSLILYELGDMNG